MADQTIDQLPLLIAPTGAEVAASKTDTDYKIAVGSANGLATLDVAGKLPITALPSHTHTIANTTGLQAALDSKQASDADLTAIAALLGTSGLLRKVAADTWTLDTSAYLTGNQTITLTGDVSGSGTTSIAVTVADDSHNHIIANVDGLQAALDGKQAAGSYAAASHTHSTANITDLASYTGLDGRYYTEAEVDSLLGGKANTSHSHAIGDVSGLQAALDAKLDDSQATATGLDILNSANQSEARDAVGIFVRATDPGAVADGSLWIW
jgi:hypothetical protein